MATTTQPATTTTGVKKNGNKTKINGVKTHIPDINSDEHWNDLRQRIFEPERDSKTFSLDRLVLSQLKSYEDYLTEKFSRAPITDRVVELLIEKGLKDISDYQSWRKSLQARRDEGFTNNNDPEQNTAETNLSRLGTVPDSNHGAK